MLLSFLEARDGRIFQPPALMGAMLAQVTADSSYAYAREGEPSLCIAGVWHEEQFSTVWFMARPQAAALMPSLCRLMLRDFRQEVLRAPSGVMRSYVVPGHRPGERLAKILGMHLVARDGGFGVWELDHGRGYTLRSDGPVSRGDDLFERPGPERPGEG